MHLPRDIQLQSQTENDDKGKMVKNIEEIAKYTSFCTNTLDIRCKPEMQAPNIHSLAKISNQWPDLQLQRLFYQLQR